MTPNASPDICPGPALLVTLDYEIRKHTAPAYNIALTVEVPFVTYGAHKLRMLVAASMVGE